MPRTKKKSNKDFVTVDGFVYPRYLFHFRESTRGILPNARVNPAAAVKGNSAWENSTSPSKIPEKKAIILDINSFKELCDFGQEAAFIKTLLDQGFRVLFKCESYIKEVSLHVEDLLLEIDKCPLRHTLVLFLAKSMQASFKDQDYSQVVKKFGIARDKTVLLKADQLEEVKKTFCDEEGQNLWQVFHGEVAKSIFTEGTNEYVGENIVYYFSNASPDGEDRTRLLDIFPQQIAENIDIFIEHFPEYTDRFIESAVKSISGQEGLYKLINKIPDHFDKIIDQCRRLGINRKFVCDTPLAIGRVLQKNGRSSCFALLNFSVGPTHGSEFQIIHGYTTLFSRLEEFRNNATNITRFKIFLRTSIEKIASSSEQDEKNNEKNYIFENLFPYIILSCNNEDEVISFFREQSAPPALIADVRSFFGNLPPSQTSIINSSTLPAFLAVTNNEQERERLIDACNFRSATSEQLLRFIQFAKNHEEKIIKKYLKEKRLSETNLEQGAEDYKSLLKYLLADKDPSFIKEAVDISFSNPSFYFVAPSIIVAINDENYSEEIYEYIIKKISTSLKEFDPFSKLYKISDAINSLEKKYITPKVLDALADLEVIPDRGTESKVINQFEIVYLAVRKKNPQNSEIENLKLAFDSPHKDFDKGLKRLRELGIISHLSYKELSNVDMRMSQPELNPRSLPTFLHIKNPAKIKDLLRDPNIRKYADSIVSLELNCIYIQFKKHLEDIKNLKQLFPNLASITISTKNFKGTPNFELNRLMKEELGRIFPNCDTHLKDYTWVYRNRLQQAASTKPPAHEIYLNEAVSDKRIDNANPQGVKYKMVKAGEILNPKPNQPKLYVRCAIIDKDNKEVLPRSYQKVNPSFIDKSDLERMKHDLSEITYHKFFKDLTPGQKYRLSSISANGEGIYVVRDSTFHARDLIITRGDDDFFYAEVTRPLKLEYVIYCEPVEKDYTKIADQKVKAIIEQYKINEAQSEGAKIPIPLLSDFRTRKEWLDALFSSGNGSCAARTNAVYHVLESERISVPFRMTDINRNHLLLEIFDRPSDKWIQVDLGGMEGEMVYEKESQPAVASFSALVQQTNEDVERIVNEKAEAERIALIEEQKRAQEAQRQVEENLRRLEHEKERLRQQTTAATRNEELQSATTIPPSRTESQEDVRRREKELAEYQKSLELEAERLRIEQAALRKKQARQELLRKLTTYESKTVELESLQISKSKTFLITDQIDKVANSLIEKAVAEGQEVFYLEDFAQTNFSSQTLEIISDADAKIILKNELVDFLKKCQALEGRVDDAQRPILFVNLDNLSDAKRAALNTMFDKDGSRTINGLKIPDHVRIVSLVSKKPNDLSLTSRHQECFEILPIQNEKVAPINPKVIDIEGLENVEEVLFGKFSLVENEIKWKKGKFLRYLESGRKEFKFINLSAEAHQKLEHLFGQAKARGYTDYYGYRINFPKDIKIEFDEEKFDFKQFTKDKVSIGKDFLLSQTPAEARIINTYLFDILLHQKTVHDGKYVEKDGLIKTHHNKTLRLFITSNLTQAQFYCMLNEAKKYNCTLELFLAKDVKLPRGLDDYHEIKEKGESQNVTKPKIFISNDTKKTTHNILREQQTRDPVIIDLEDYNYQDLISEIRFKKTADAFKDFEKITSDVLKAIKAGYKVILRGQFSQDILKMLEPVIASEPPEFSNVGNNLILIIEDKNISKTQQVYSELGWLDAKSYRICDEAKTQTQQNGQVYKEQPDLRALDENSLKRSNAFIQNRKNIFAALLHGNSLLSLIGPSGVGKSSLMRLMAEQHKNFMKIYHDLSSFEDWAKDKSDAELITLFIDESNIEDMHFTMFEQLKRGGNREILYKGKLYQLTDKHRVVFARNPKEYGGGRVDQKLFADGECAEMHCADFPAAYLYEELLKKAIYDKLDLVIKTQIDEKAFRQACQGFITQYQDINKKNADKPNEQETARELQDQALQYIADLLPKKNYAIKSKDFVSIEASAAVEDALNSAITIKKQQIMGKFPSNGIGINGVLFEGHSAIGKSESIAAVFRNRGIKNVNELDDPTSEYCYYKIEASLSIDEKINLLIEAFEGGNIAWLDEMDSCIENDGFEKALNSLLTGFNPRTGKALKNEGGILVSSVNSAAVEGRAIIGSALRHRMRTVRATSLSEYKIQDFETILSTWIEYKNDDENKYEIRELASFFVEYFKDEQHPKLNLRIIRNHLDEFLELYKREQIIGGQSFLKEQFETLRVLSHVDVELNDNFGIFIWLEDNRSRVKYGIMMDKNNNYTKVSCARNGELREIIADDKEFTDYLSELSSQAQLRENQTVDARETERPNPTPRRRLSRNPNDKPTQPQQLVAEDQSEEELYV